MDRTDRLTYLNVHNAFVDAIDDHWYELEMQDLKVRLVEVWPTWLKSIRHMFAMAKKATGMQVDCTNPKDYEYARALAFRILNRLPWPKHTDGGKL